MMGGKRNKESRGIRGREKIIYQKEIFNNNNDKFLGLQICLSIKLISEKSV